MRWRRIGSLVLGIAVSAVFVLLILRRVDLGEVLAHAAAASPRFLAASLFTMLGGLLCQSRRAQLLLVPLAHYPLRRTFRAQLLALAGNNLLPLRLGELLRVDFLARKGHLPRAACLAVALCERLLDSFWLMALFVGIVPFLALSGVSTLRLGWLVIILLLGLALLAVLGRNPRPVVAFTQKVAAWLGTRSARWIEGKLADFLEGLGMLHGSRRMLAAVGWTLGYWGFSMASIALWLQAFSLDLPASAPLVILGFMAFGTALPSSPGFVGTYHYFTQQALELYGIEPAVATSFAVVGHAVATVPFTLVAAAVLARELRAGIAAVRSGEPLLRRGEEPTLTSDAAES